LRNRGYAVGLLLTLDSVFLKRVRLDAASIQLGKDLQSVPRLRFSLRRLVFVGLATGCNRRPELGFEVFREFVELGIAIDLYGLFGRVADHIAVVAPSQVLFEFGFGAGVNDAV
jgi:hypothetical protein